MRICSDCYREHRDDDGHICMDCGVVGTRDPAPDVDQFLLVGVGIIYLCDGCRDKRVKATVRYVAGLS